jgi:uncharacterized protein with HEPN domain
MSGRIDADYLKDILEAAHRIMIYIDGMTLASFLDDIKTQDSVIRNLEIIGEATKSLTEELREQYSDVPWKGMAGVRDRLIHHYFGVNLDIVWNIIAFELPSLEEQIETILNNEFNTG